MSRCFPYPPPGYTRNGIRDEALIESIKLQREVEKAKKERTKERKREKKEKEKAEGNEEVESKKHHHKKRHGEERSRENQKRGDHQKRRKIDKEHLEKSSLTEERSRENRKGGDHQKTRKIDKEHLEKSSLTEEHGNPAGSQNSTDSTLNSNRRQSQCLLSDDRHNSGSIIRIRLPVQRHKDSKVLPSKGQPRTAFQKSVNSSVQQMHEPASVPSREEPVSILGLRPDNTSIQPMPNPASVPGTIREQPNSSFGVRSDNPSIQQMSKPASGPAREGEQPNSSLGVKFLNPSIQWMEEPAVTGKEGKDPCSPSGSTGQELTLTRRKDKPALSHGASENLTLLPKSTSPSHICRSCPPSLALQFRELVEDWVPSELEIECSDLDNESWLFEMDQDHSQNNGTKSCEVGSVGLSYLNSMSWPYSQYLPEADVHALPFTVPF